LKGGLLNHALYVLRLALATVLALLPLGTALIAGLALVGASFLLLFYFNPFFKRTRQVQLLGQFCLMLVYGFTLGVQYIDSSSGKFGLTVVAEVAILMNGAGALVIAIWWILFGNKDAEQVVPREKHS
jgi:glucan phosphoethanolaminetransferase (alkaline phosphatase superfamily)